MQQNQAPQQQLLQQECQEQEQPLNRIHQHNLNDRKLLRYKSRRVNRKKKKKKKQKGLQRIIDHSRLKKGTVFHYIFVSNIPVQVGMLGKSKQA